VYAAATRAAANALGLGVFSKTPSDSVTGINYPAGFTDKEFRGALRKQLNMNVAAGQGTMEGKMFRISHMGYVDQTDTLGVIANSSTICVYIFAGPTKFGSDGFDMGLSFGGGSRFRGSGQRRSGEGSASFVAEARHAGNISIAPMRKHKAPSSVPATATRVLSTSSERGST